MQSTTFHILSPTFYLCIHQYRVLYILQSIAKTVTTFFKENQRHIDTAIKIRRMEPAAGFEPAWNSFAGCCVKPLRMGSYSVPHTPPHWHRYNLFL